MRPRRFAEMQSRTANQTGKFAAFRRMADQSGGFVDDEQSGVFKNDVKKFFHARGKLPQKRGDTEKNHLVFAGLSVRRFWTMLRRMKEKWNRCLPAIFVALFAASRIPGLLPLNFSAAYAFAFCAGVYFSKRLSWWLPLLVLLATDIGLNFYYQNKYPDDNVWSASNLANLAFNYAAYAVLIFLGRRFKPQSSFVSLLGGGILGAILFYLITNTASWFFNPFHNPEYTEDFPGWLLALTRGVNGWPTTLEFFRNTLLSGVIFTALFAGAAKWTAAESPAEKNAGAREAENKAEEKPEEASA
jgi:hypothetical protein